ncbi:MAG: TIGR03936 family radical SAM-associated protein [Clostridiales bacterium]|nr:TIGR03936 family radical SAM-associated protein [Clostridiales bacterium]
MKIRIKFKKYGTMKFIGHLDVMRYFQKAIRRADVDIRYSEGFSPHQIMSFAAPLGVGITSNGEYVDIEVLSTRDSRTMVDALNAVMAEGFEIISYRLLPDQAANAMSIVSAADYTISFRPGYEPEEMEVKEWFEALIRFFEQPQVLVTKKTKKGETQVDLKPLVYELRMAGEDRLFLKVSTGSVSNIKPDMILDAFYKSRGQERPPFAFMIQREEVYADLGDRGFIPLEDLGEEITPGQDGIHG